MIPSKVRFFKFLKKIPKISVKILLLTLVYIIALVNGIESETLQITTYYPAPYGAYVSILTTGNTFLARDGGNVGIGTQSPAFKLDIQGGSVRIAGRLSTNNYNPDAGYPPGWGGGIHTWDIYAEGTVGAGQGGALRSWINAWGDGGVSQDFSVGRNLWITGSSGGFCRPFYYPNATCPGDYPRAVGFLPDNNWNSYVDFYATEAGTLNFTRYRFSTFTSGWLVCCRIIY